MPRTKRPRKVRTSIESNELELKREYFDKQSKMRLKNLDEECERIIKQMESNIDAALNRLPKEVREMTFRELFTILPEYDNEAMDHNDENESEIIPASTKKNIRKHVSRVDSKSVKSKKTIRNTSTSSEVKNQPFATEISNSTVSSAKASQRSNSSTRDKKNLPMDNKRSSSTAGRIGRQSKHLDVPSAKKTVDPTPAKNRIVNPTPTKNNKVSVAPLSAINKADDHVTTQTKTYDPTPKKNLTPPKNYYVTPKVNLRTPVNILRRPREGEMALSMDGSPLYVSALAHERMANINVPLHNGNVLSFLPRDELRMSRLPDLDSETLRQLKTLKNHIEKVIGQK